LKEGGTKRRRPVLFEIGGPIGRIALELFEAGWYRRGSIVCGASRWASRRDSCSASRWASRWGSVLFEMGGSVGRTAPILGKAGRSKGGDARPQSRGCTRRLLLRWRRGRWQRGTHVKAFSAQLSRIEQHKALLAIVKILQGSTCCCCCCCDGFPAFEAIVVGIVVGIVVV